MYPSVEARPGPSEATINLFARIVNVLKLTLLIIFVKSTTMNVWKVLVTPLNFSNAGNKLNDPNSWV